MTTLVTGGTGFLGGALTRALVRRGDRVRVLVRPQTMQTMGTVPVEFVPGDVTDRASLEAAGKGCDRVFHAAGLVATWRRNRSEFDRVNVDGTRNVIEAALAAGASRIVCTSTFLVLKPSERPMTEDTRADAADARTDYGRTKRLAREVVDGFIAKGAPIVTVYPGVIFGPGSAWAKPGSAVAKPGSAVAKPGRGTAGGLITGWIARFLKGDFPGYLGRGDRKWSFAFVEDVARGHLLADEKGRPGLGYNLGGENTTIRAFMELVAQLAGREPPKRCVPYSLAKCVGWLHEVRASLTGKEPELTRAVVDTFRHPWPLDSTRAQTELGYTITPLAEAIGRTLAWVRETTQ